jgi:leader peptidase (prepilin peptidase)/N-methyltransferase
MGMGDVKLALVLGTILGWPQTILWLFLSFLVGGLFAIILLILKKTSLGKRIAFGPFLVAAFIIVVFFGGNLLRYFRL